ncbi:hypothetical protein I312_102411 [Cryptococcus bacillisporus CA1280]|uniref:uncharacterized protein n=1 Tax=Cryptococcus bacillisporus CA1280 TaxID=1296109 RepID=UPI003367B22F
MFFVSNRRTTDVGVLRFNILVWNVHSNSTERTTHRGARTEPEAAYGKEGSARQGNLDFHSERRTGFTTVE